MSGEIKITLEDVETAIKVLNAYYRLHRQAQLALRRTGMLEGSGSRKGFSMENFMEMAYETVKAKKTGTALPSDVENATPEVDLTPEELERIRQIKKEMKG
jgi:hypothetical protein